MIWGYPYFRKPSFQRVFGGCLDLLEGFLDDLFVSSQRFLDDFWNYVSVVWRICFPEIFQVSNMGNRQSMGSLQSEGSEINMATLLQIFRIHPVDTVFFLPQNGYVFCGEHDAWKALD